MSAKSRYQPPEECKQAVIFARVSSERQERGESIQAQLETVHEYCKKKNFTILQPEFVITESSSRGDRKQYHEMLSFVEKQKHKTAIVVNCVDRLQRSYKDTPKLDELRRAGKIEVHFLKENLILHKDSSGMEIMFWNMSVLMANSYIISLSDNVKRSQKYNRKQGKWQGNAPIGYLNTRDENNKATVTIDPVRGPIIKKMFEEYATGLHSLASVMELGSRLGLTSKKKEQRGMRSQRICRNTVFEIFRNPFYYGYMYNEGVLQKHIYEPLIDKELFDRVQEVRGGKNNAHMQNVDYGKMQFAFRGLTKCAHCGCAMTPEAHTKNGKVFTYLKCTHNKGPCPQKPVSEKALLQQLNDEVFSKIHFPKSILESIQSAVQQKLETESNISVAAKRMITEKLEKNKVRQKRLFQMYLDGEIEKADYEQNKAEMEQEKEQLEQQNEKVQVIGGDIKEVVKNIIMISAHIPELMNKATPTQQRELLNLLLTDCTISGKTLHYKLRKPFDKFLSSNKASDWKNISADDIQDVKGIKYSIEKVTERLN